LDAAQLVASSWRTAREGGRHGGQKTATMQEADHGSRVPPTHVPPPGALAEKAGPHALQILMTEHWSLLSARSLGYTEAMTRASIFVAALTGSVVALALVAQATEFDDSFLAFALVLLPVVFFLGFVTIVRLAQITWEDGTWVQGMNRLRNAYHDLAPEVEPYFVTSRYDDDEGVTISAVAQARLIPQLQGFVAIPGVVAVLDAVVAGAIAAIAALGIGAGTAASVGIGVGIFVLTLVGFAALAVWTINLFRHNIDTRFPTPHERSKRPKKAPQPRDG
jgi:hypothetical protein